MKEMLVLHGGLAPHSYLCVTLEFVRIVMKCITYSDKILL